MPPSSGWRDASSTTAKPRGKKKVTSAASHRTSPLGPAAAAVAIQRRPTTATTKNRTTSGSRRTRRRGVSDGITPVTMGARFGSRKRSVVAPREFLRGRSRCATLRCEMANRRGSWNATDGFWLGTGALAILILLWTCRHAPLGVPAADDYDYLYWLRFHRFDV